MFQGFLKILGARPDEYTAVSLLLAKGFCMGVFIATYDVVATTQFMNQMGDLYGEAVILTGLLGAITTSVYSALQRRIPFKNLMIGILLFILIFLVSTQTAYAMLEGDSGSLRLLVFLCFIMMGPLNAIVLLGFWGFFGRLFDNRQSKRIIGGIDTGQLSATILTFLSTPILIELLGGNQKFYYLSAVATVFSLFFSIYIFSKLNVNSVLQKSDGENLKGKLEAFTKNRYVLLLSLFIIFSVIIARFVDYSFLTSMKERYSQEVDFSNFYATVMATIMLLSFLIQTFVNDRIIGVYGLRVALTILPVILVFLTGMAIVSGTIFGYTIEGNENYLWFFLFIVLSQLFTVSLRDALENPAFKLFFLPLNIRIRFDTQAKIEGTVSEIAVAAAGAILLGLKIYGKFELIHYSFFLIIFVVGLILITHQLYQEYRNTLKSTLSKEKDQGQIKAYPELTSIGLIKRFLNAPNPAIVIFCLKVLEKIEPIEFESIILDFVDHDNDELSNYAKSKITNLGSFSALNEVQKQLPPGIKIPSLHGLDSLDIEVTGDLFSQQNLERLSLSSDANVREFVSRVAPEVKNVDYGFLFRLLNDKAPQVRNAAIISAGKLKQPEFWPYVIQNLQDSQFSSSAIASLTNIGKTVLPNLENAFYKSGQETETMIKILQIYGKIGTTEAISLLWNKIDFPDKRITTQIIKSLSYSGYEASKIKATIIRQNIEDTIGHIISNMAAILDISQKQGSDSQKPGSDLLIKALEEENQFYYEQFYISMSLIYEAQSILLVKENIEKGTDEGVAYALELLDIFLAEDLKALVLPVLDDVSYEEKVRRLQEHYLIERKTFLGVLVSLMNKEYNFINRWTKACALYIYADLEDATLGNDIIANLFNPDQLLRETAAYSIFRMDPDYYNFKVKNSQRFNLRSINPVVYDNKGLELNSGEHSLQIAKVLFLRSLDIFKSIPFMFLVELVPNLEIQSYQAGETIEFEDYVDPPLVLVAEGEIQFTNNLVKKTFLIKEGQIFADVLRKEFDQHSSYLKVLSDSMLIKIDNRTFFDFLAENHLVFDGLFQQFSPSNQAEELVS